MVASGVDVQTSGSGARSAVTSVDGVSLPGSFAGMAAQSILGGGRPPLPADIQEFADLLGNRLRTEDALQVK